MSAEPTPRPVNAMASGSPAAVTELSAGGQLAAELGLQALLLRRGDGSLEGVEALRAGDVGVGDGHVVRHGEQRGVAVVRDAGRGDLAGVRDGGQPLGEVADGRPVEGRAVLVVDDDLRLGTAAAGDVVPEHLDAALGAGARHVVVVRGRAAEGRRRRDRDADDEQPGGDRAPGVGRGAVAEAVEDA